MACRVCFSEQSVSKPYDEKDLYSGSSLVSFRRAACGLMGCSAFSMSPFVAGTGLWTELPQSASPASSLREGAGEHRSQSLPHRGRWRPEGSTEGVAQRSLPSIKKPPGARRTILKINMGRRDASPCRFSDRNDGSSQPSPLAVSDAAGITDACMPSLPNSFGKGYVIPSPAAAGPAAPR